MAVVVIDGNTLQNEKDFHVAFAKQTGILRYYGQNGNALWDMLTAGVEMPLHIEWIAHEKSKAVLGEQFDMLIRIFDDVIAFYAKFEPLDKFTYCLC